MTTVLRVSSAAQDVAEQIATDERWAEAEEHGLLSRRALIDPASPDVVVVDTKWKSVDAIREFTSRRPDFLDFRGGEVVDRQILRHVEA